MPSHTARDTVGQEAPTKASKASTSACEVVPFWAYQASSGPSTTTLSARAAAVQLPEREKASHSSVVTDALPSLYASVARAAM